ncbi:hypothetical protein [Corynebacterium sp. HMSC071B10]|uniref:hypothetical protein n=1 Tax=Corynebacterium sp. HMSC071B10 TaxID=1739494 RepID=UPI0008A2D713|nr:hypothetical protein [Corynebacterium sp. HMSC071B10]OFP34679.1 hypothetical protein HMPREF2990_01165 [Corynebacterium sp. HMSC071B10]
MSTDRARRWMLTVPAEGDAGVSREQIEDALEPYTAYLGQMERAESGYLHWQILLVHEQPIRFSTLKNRLPTAHLETARELAKCVAYVQKADTRVEDEPPLVKGLIEVGPGQGHRSDLDDLRARILDGQETVDGLIMDDATAWRHGRMTADLVAARDRARLGSGTRDVQVRVIYGDTGTGKTSAAIQGLQALGSVCRVTHWGPGAFDGYDGQDSLILDEFAGQPSISALLTWLDRYPVDLPARYRSRPAAYLRVVLCTNAQPWDWYPEAPKAQRAALARRLHLVEHWAGSWDNVTVTEIPSAEVMARMTAEPPPMVGF